MDSIFQSAWSDLEAEHVEAFLADAGDEGLTWEAKGGGDPPHRESLQKAVSGDGSLR